MSDLLLNLFADDKNLITYRPKWAKQIGSITAAIFLQQVFFYWHSRGKEPFYKFNAPCEHDLYKAGDSWRETLGFSKYELSTARKKVSVKKTADMSMEDAVELAHKESKPVIYWTDAGRVTHYAIIPDIFTELLRAAYADQNTESSNSKIWNPELANAGKQNLVNPESRNRNTETLTENTREDSSPDGERPSDDDSETDSRRDLFFEQMCDILGWDWHIVTEEQRGQLNQTCKILKDAGYTVADLKAFEVWWYEHDWRGQKGQTPEDPATIRKNIAKARNKKGSNPEDVKRAWCLVWDRGDQIDRGRLKLNPPDAAVPVAGFDTRKVLYEAGTVVKAWTYCEYVDGQWREVATEKEPPRRTADDVASNTAPGASEAAHV